MNKRAWIWLALPALAAGGLAWAQFPIMDLVANKVIEKYQGSTCEQLWQRKTEPKSAEAQRLIKLLQEDPAMRAAFLNKVGGPVANKMFDCGMIP